MAGSMSNRVLIFSVSAGAGHVRAAQALEAAAGKFFPEVKVVHIDVMDIVPKLFKKVYSESYIKIVEEHPAVWGYLYDRADQESADSPANRLRILVERLNTNKIKKVLEELDPGHIICTHFLPAQLLSRLIKKGRFNKPVWVQVTDFDVHALWLHEHMTGYFAANEEVAWRLSARGIPEASVHATGIPVMPAFCEERKREECAAEFGLDPSRKTILMMSGGAGIGGIGALARDLLSLNDNFQLVALSGRNARLLSELQKVAECNPGRLYPMGFTNAIERVMSASDLAVTKPGGLTTSECLAVGLPMVVVSPIPGQEERNSDFLLENGAALKACDSAALLYRVRMLLRNPVRLEELRIRARGLGKPDAARRVLETVLR